MTVARRLVGFNLLTACLLGIGGWYVGWFAAHAVVGPSIAFFGDVDFNELSLVMGYLCGVLGFLAMTLVYAWLTIHRLRVAQLEDDLVDDDLDAALEARRREAVSA